MRQTPPKPSSLYGIRALSSSSHVYGSRFPHWCLLVDKLFDGVVDGYLDGTLTTQLKTLEVEKADKNGAETMPISEYGRWIAQDQQVLGYLLSSLSCEVLTQVVSMKTAAEVSAALEEMCSSISRSRIIQLQTAAAYFSKMRAIADELTVAGKKVEDNDLISQLLSGLDEDYNLFVLSIAARTDAYSLSELYAQILAFEVRLESQNPGSRHYNSSANLAARCGRRRENRGGRGNGGGNHGGFTYRGGYNGGNYNNNGG
nr:uncharacterized protein LOC127297672 [Lolium perenne]